MKKVYVISQYAAPTEYGCEFNRRVARYFCRQIVFEGKIPVAPHLFYTQFLDDNKIEEREIGAEMGLRELRKAAEFLLIIIDGKISEGMQQEIRQAAKDGMNGRVVYMTHKEIGEVMG